MLVLVLVSQRAPTLTLVAVTLLILEGWLILGRLLPGRLLPLRAIWFWTLAILWFNMVYLAAVFPLHALERASSQASSKLSMASS